jgi:predicted GIY-YIG superfamily endonuclease
MSQISMKGGRIPMRSASGPIEVSPNRWFVYILEATTKRGRVSVHVGIALNVGRRIMQHRHGDVKATRGRTIVWLGNSEAMKQGDALRLEMKLKKLSAEDKRAQADAWK